MKFISEGIFYGYQPGHFFFKVAYLRLAVSTSFYFFAATLLPLQNMFNPFIIGAGALLFWKANNKIQAVNNFRFLPGGLPKISLQRSTLKIIFPITASNNSIESFMVNRFNANIYFGTSYVGECFLVSPVLINPKVKSGFEVAASLYLTSVAIALVKAINGKQAKEKLSLRGTVEIGSIVKTILPVNITFDI